MASKDHVCGYLPHLLANKGLGRLGPATSLSSGTPSEQGGRSGRKSTDLKRCSPDPRSKRERAQARRSRDLGGRARQTKAPAAPIDTVMSSSEQTDGQKC